MRMVCIDANESQFDYYTEPAPDYLTGK
ncbi:hypothetical protein AvCA_10450 [Azotobacter vinelandii CA]|uniref:Uncharacterized protein n=2 Tax=Azotobacter vinelandii TaxID=354 RepID=C1DNR1_AZOVD|nr:hypothetical protein Avin_10450 [Azotobacter vinelandii DJ]AGK15423.1 hypothetical protein AvCA_10450 [Azotobacter vinelandii CA]AGK19687.1 hypothetical protein AvCA6_10450 [Azotobacter vinelandii CA6]